MRLWLFLLCMVIASALAIWGCIAIIDTPEPVQLTVEFSASDVISQNLVN